MAGWFKKISAASAVQPEDAGRVPAQTSKSVPVSSSETTLVSVASSLAQEVARLKQSANAFLYTGNLPAATAEFHRATLQGPTDAGAWTGLGFALYQSGKLADAARTLDTAAQLAADSADVYFLQGNIARDQDQLPRAQAAFARAVALEPGLVVAWPGLAQSLARSGDFDTAMKVLGEALANSS
jgi:Flp pilus assembly protein TadD